MRIYIVAVALLIAPPVGLFAYKHYWCHESIKSNESHESEGQKELTAHQTQKKKTRGEVLFFNASWCGPCRQMKPIVSSLRAKGYNLRDLDVDKNRTLAAKYKVHSIPTFVFVENGSEVRRFSGGTSADNLRKMCSSSAYH